MENKTQTIRLVDFVGRYVDLHMKGTWGYNPRNVAIITAESYIEEFHVTDVTALDRETGKELKSPLIIGTDKYGRELNVPIDRILAVGWLDTKEQSSLYACKKLLDGYDNVTRDVIDSNDFLSKMYAETQARYDELVAKGVTPYQRRGE